jgi:hypothetical protein
MSNASIGYDADILVSDTLNGTYTSLLSEPLVVSVPTDSVNKVKATHLKSPGRTNEYVPGMFDPGEASYEANWTKEDFAALFALKGVVKYFKIVSPDRDGTGPITRQSYTFPGYPTNIELSFSVDDGSPTKMTFDIVSTGVTVVA